MKWTEYSVWLWYG